MAKRTDSLGMRAYLRDVRRHRIMDRDEEHAVALEFTRTGAPALAARLVAANLRLVVKIATEYRRTSASLADLVQEGNVGLMHAVKRYEPRRGLRFTSYAGWWIHSYILRFLRDELHLAGMKGVWVYRQQFLSLRKERERLESRGVNPDPARLARALGTSERTVLETDRFMGASYVALDAPVRSGEEEGRTRSELIPAEPDCRPDVRVEESDFSACLRRGMRAFVAGLSDRDAQILSARMLSDEPATLAALAMRFGLSSERVRQLEANLRDQLRHRFASEFGPPSASRTPPTSIPMTRIICRGSSGTLS